MIKLNKNRAGRLSGVVFGLAEIADGIVRVCSLGFLLTRLPLEVSKYQAKRALDKLIKRNTI